MSNSSTITRVPDTGHDYASFVSPLPHPGALLREDYLEDYGLTPDRLAFAMELELPLVEAVLAEEAPITADFALRLGKVFNQAPDLWMRLQGSHDISKAAIVGREALSRLHALPAQAA